MRSYFYQRYWQRSIFIICSPPKTLIWNKMDQLHDHWMFLSWRSSRQWMFCEKGVPRNFTKFTGKNQCQSLVFNKKAGLRPATLLEKRLWHRCFPENFAKFVSTPFFTEHFWWLLPELVENELKKELIKKFLTIFFKPIYRRFK